VSNDGDAPPELGGIEATMFNHGSSLPRSVLPRREGERASRAPSSDAVNGMGSGREVLLGRAPCQAGLMIVHDVPALTPSTPATAATPVTWRLDPSKLVSLVR
jgi:hypothetical protein